MKLHWPLENVSNIAPIALTGGQVYISQHFGENPQIYSQFGLKGHDGLDLAAPLGTPVHAAHDGFLIESFTKNTDYGIRVVLYNEEKQFTTIYGHFQKSAFPEVVFNWNERGYPIKAGDLIGYVNSTGFSTGNHLHFGLRFYNNYQIINYNNGFYGYVDPEPFLLKKGEMQILQVNGEQTLVIKNEDGKFYEVATTPDLYPVVAKILGLKDNATFDSVQRAEVDANLGGQAKAGLTFINK